MTAFVNSNRVFQGFQYNINRIGAAHSQNMQMKQLKMSLLFAFYLLGSFIYEVRVIRNGFVLWTYFFFLNLKFFLFFDFMCFRFSHSLEGFMSLYGEWRILIIRAGIEIKPGPNGTCYCAICRTNINKNMPSAM